MKSKHVKRKVRGRPATGTDPLVGVRMPEEFRKQIEDWAAAQDEGLSLSAAVRRLVERGLAWSTGLETLSQAKRSKAKGAENARAVAEKRIDGLQPHERPRTGQGNRKKALTEVSADLLHPAKGRGK